MTTSTNTFRSIPAHAGEPRTRRGPSRVRRVYPRARGGAATQHTFVPGNMGLSPRTRGSHFLRVTQDRVHGSIPAHAGEPSRTGPTVPPTRVYPRARGGAKAHVVSDVDSKGLSPRTRGSRRHAPHGLLDARSIPAHAGEPHRPAKCASFTTVYPRARGGAFGAAGDLIPGSGLSPRTRGSRHFLCEFALATRSIPAHAGEPSPRTEQNPRLWVYPRARGGAEEIAPNYANAQGLSPRTRGSLLGGESFMPERGSIPAHAGEPKGALRHWPLR